MHKTPALLSIFDIAAHVEAENAVKAKDDAILVAQRQGSGQLKLAVMASIRSKKSAISIISRLVESGFSLKKRA